MPEVIYEEVVEVNERVCMVQDSCKLGLTSPVVMGTTGEKVSDMESYIIIYYFMLVVCMANAG